MTTSGHRSVTGRLRWLHANWPALLLPLVMAGVLGLLHGLAPDGPVRGPWPVLLIIMALLAALLAPAASAEAAPFALLGYGAFGLYLVHLELTRLAVGQLYYGLVHVYPANWMFLISNAVELRNFERSGALHSFVQIAPHVWRVSANSGSVDLVLAEAVAFLVAGVALLGRTGAPGGRAVRRAVAQLRGSGGQPRTVPPLLLLPVIFLWEELFGQHLWFGLQGGAGFGYWPPVLAALAFVVGAAAVRWTPRTAAILAVTGIVAFGLCGLAPAHLLTDAPAVPFYGAVLLDGGVSTLLAVLQGVVFVVAGCALAPRLLVWDTDTELTERAWQLTQRVDRLTVTRSDATETAVSELRRIERDLHDGAQARLVAVGMSLRAVEQLIGSNPDAALALVAEARETSSRALADLRDLVRGIYPPVLADRGLADAVRTLALDAMLPVEVTVDLPGEPPMPVAAAVYFAVAEALTNAVRHAGACTVTAGVEYTGAGYTGAVSARQPGGMLRATVTDDGHGGADPAAGTGLAGVERRLATFDGILAVSSPAGGPTIVVIEVPCALSSVKTFSC